MVQLSMLEVPMAYNVKYQEIYTKILECFLKKTVLQAP